MPGVNLRHELLARGLSARTAQLYYREITRALSWCEDRGLELKRLPLAEVLAYADSRPFTFSTRKLVRDALRHYWEITGRKDPPLKAIRVPKRPEMVCKALEEDDLRILGKAARARGDDPGLAVCLGLYQGLRRAEIASLTWTALDLESGWLTVCGKGDKTGRLPIHKNVAELVRAKPANRSRFLFPSPKGGPVTPMCIWNWARRVSDEAGVGKVAPHRLRHSSIAEINDRSGDLRGAQTFARHSDPRVTSGYSRTKDRRLVELVALLDY